MQLALARQDAKEQGESDDAGRRSDDSYSPPRQWCSMFKPDGEAWVRGLKNSPTGAKGPLQQGPCHQTSDRQYRSHAYRRARSAMSYIGLSLPNRIPDQNCKSGELWTSFWH